MHKLRPFRDLTTRLQTLRSDIAATLDGKAFCERSGIQFRHGTLYIDQLDAVAGELRAAGRIVPAPPGNYGSDIAGELIYANHLLGACEPPTVIPPTPTQWSTPASKKHLMGEYGITRRTFQKMKIDGDIRQDGREQFSVRLDRVTPKPPPTPPKTATNSNQLRPTRTNSTNIGKESFRNGG